MKIKLSSKFYHCLTILTAIIAVMALIAIFGPYFTMGYNKKSCCSNFGAGWNLDDKKTVNLEDYKFKKKKDGKAYVLKKALPAMTVDNEELMFLTQHFYFKVYLDEEEIYSFLPPSNKMIGKSYDSKVHFVNLGRNSGSKVITVVVDPIYNDASGHFRYIEIGNSGVYIRNQIQE